MKKEYVHHNPGQPINVNTDQIHIENRIGTWYVIAETIRQGRKVFLLEHEEYGDETEHIAVDESGTLIRDEIYDDFPNCLDD